MPVPVIRSDAHLAHDGLIEVASGRAIPCYEAPARLVEIERALRAAGGCTFEEPSEHGLEPILAVHDPGLVAALAEAWPTALAEGLNDGRSPLLPDAFLTAAYAAGHQTGRPGGGHRLWSYAFDVATPVVEGTYRAARAAVDVALSAMERVAAGEALAYGLCRPPGHHAGRAMYGGYCFFNNAAIVATALRAGGAGRSAILDVDYHHGNGTQQLCYERGDVLYVSLHADPSRAYPYYSGSASETGAGAGEGLNLNLPLPAGTAWGAYRAALESGLDAIARFAPDGPLVISLGFDTYRTDPIGDLALETDDYGRMGALIRSLGLPCIVLQEGGYAIEALGANAVAFLAGLGAG